MDELKREPQTIKYWFSDKRAITYLLWAVLTVFGFVMTHFRQQKQINGLWFLIILVGLGYMVRVMPLKEKRMQAILATWAVVLLIGMAISRLVFDIEAIAEYVRYLGVVWLFIMAVGYAVNGLVDAPMKWYMIAAAVNVLAGVVIWAVPSLLSEQYLIAAVVSGWSMLMLWVFRSEYL